MHASEAIPLNHSRDGDPEHCCSGGRHNFHFRPGAPRTIGDLISCCCKSLVTVIEPEKVEQADGTPDPAASALDGIRENFAMRSKHAQGLGADPADFRRLLKVAETALAFHEESGGSCGSCLDAYGDRLEWPCEEYRAITAELTGKEAGDADPR